MINQGDDGDFMFVIETGILDCYKKAGGEEKLIKAIKESPMLSTLPMYEQMKLCESLKAEELKAGAVVCTAGDAGECMYFVQSGSLSTANASGTAGLTHAAGDYFGEKALLSGEPRSMTVTAAEDSIVLAADKSTFKSLLGGIKGKLEEAQSRYTA